MAIAILPKIDCHIARGPPPYYASFVMEERETIIYQLLDIVRRFGGPDGGGPWGSRGPDSTAQDSTARDSTAPRSSTAPVCKKVGLYGASCL